MHKTWEYDFLSNEATEKYKTYLTTLKMKTHILKRNHHKQALRNQRWGVQ